jgi:hypothetical protein
LADIVAKRFFASRRATLIQKMNPSRKIDSSGAPVGFDSCALGGSPTFATKSAQSGQSSCARVCPLLDQSGQKWILARNRLSANDPTATFSVHCGNNFGVGFSHYQSTSLN